MVLTKQIDTPLFGQAQMFSESISTSVIRKAVMDGRKIRLMQHAIGLNNPYSKVRKGCYTAYRNYFVAGKGDASWDELVAAGLATKRQDTLYELNTVYHLTEKGINILAEIMNIKIIEAK